MTELPLVDSGFVVPVFSLGDDPIACLNKAMAFLTAVASSRFPSTNNQLRTSSNPRNQATIQDGRVTVQQTEDLDTCDSDCDDISNTKAVLMTNISNYGSDVISKVPHSKTYLDDMENQSVHAVHDFEQTLVVDFSDNEIHRDSNIILYSQYLQETQLINVQDTNLQAQQDSMILSVIEQMSEQMINHVNNWEKANKEQNSESVTAELERYKERVKTFEQRQSAQIVHMLTKPQAFYDNIHKQALGYQNPFYLKKAQRIKSTLYDGIVIFAKHVAMHVIDDEETLILEEDSRSKMFEKEKDPEAIKQNIYHNPIDYEKLNRLSDDFGKRFTPQQELSAKRAFWLRMSNPTSKPSNVSDPRNHFTL
ncbi:hypothetical protein Tco_1410785 [Tanacetum coccineum]